MAWVRIEDGFPEHRKVAAAGDEAGWMFVCGLAYCARALTDGFVPVGQVVKLTGLRAPLKLAGRLVEVGLWERETEGFRVHDYLVYQPSAADVLDRRRRTAERVKKHRSNEASNGVTSGVSNGNVTPDVLTQARGTRASGSGTTTTSSQGSEASDARAEYRRLSALLADQITERDPNAKVAPLSKPWLDAVRLLHERDGRPVEQIEAVIRWLPSDFWGTVVLSAPKLREKFTQIVAKMGGTPNGSRLGGGRAKASVAKRNDLIEHDD